MTSRISLPLLLAGALAACVSAPARVIVPGPHAAQAEITEHRGRTCVSLSARTEGCYDGVNLGAVTFSDDGRSAAYPARIGELWTVVHDDHSGAVWPGVGAPALSPDGRRLAYPAWDGRAWRVVVDGMAGDAFDALLAGSLAFDPTGRRYAYAAQREDVVRVVVDGSVSDGWDAVARITFSPSGDNVAWLARSGAAALVVLNGVAGAAHDEVSELALGDARFSYAARDGTTWRVVHGALHSQDSPVRETYGPYDGVAHLAVGRSIWFVARSGGRAAVLRDGQPFGWHDDITELVPGTGRDAGGAPGADEAWGYVAIDGDSSTVIIAGRVAGRWPSVVDLAIAADGRRYAFVTADSTGTDEIVDDAGRYAFERVIEGTLHFSSCGYWSALVLPTGRGRDLRVVVDGAVTATRLEWPALVRLLRRPDPSSTLRSWVASAAASERGSPGC